MSRLMINYFAKALKMIELLDSSDVFYKQFAMLFFDESELVGSKRRIRNSIRIIKAIERIYTMKIGRCRNVKKMMILRKEAYGRILSILKRGRKALVITRELWFKMKNLPSVRRDIPTIAVAGPPNTGKSSLVRKLSTAKVKIASYPFTTKEITVGHLRLKNRMFQVMDTPGLLDRPMKERNLIERKSILCLRYIADVIVFLFDVSNSKYYSIKEQAELFHDIRSTFKEKEIIPVINKIDIIEKEKEADKIEELIESKVIKISVVKGIGLNELTSEILKRLTR